MFDEKIGEKQQAFFLGALTIWATESYPFSRLYPSDGTWHPQPPRLAYDVTLYLTTYCTSPVIRTPAKGFGDPRSTD